MGEMEKNQPIDAAAGGPHAAFDEENELRGGAVLVTIVVLATLGFCLGGLIGYAVCKFLG